MNDAWHSWHFVCDGALRIGYGQSDTTKAGTNSTLDVSGTMQVSGAIEGGAGSGSVSLTTNDGYGNANVNFNHKNGIPDVTGSSARITSNVDSTTAKLGFQLKDSTTLNTAVGLSEIMYLTSTGMNVTGSITASGDITAFSDERLKTDINTIDNALQKVKELRGVSFTKDGKSSIGVIAQEVERIIPEVVHDGDYKSVAYGNLVGLLIEAIKELNDKIEKMNK